MNEDKSSLGDRIRHVADNLRHENRQQIHAISNILATAAKITVNHEALIDEIVAITLDDLSPKLNLDKYTAKELEAIFKKRFKTLKKAKQYLGVKANSWKMLSQKVYAQISAEIRGHDQSLVSIKNGSNFFREEDYNDQHIGDMKQAVFVDLDYSESELYLLQRIENLEHDLMILKNKINQIHKIINDKI